MVTPDGLLYDGVWMEAIIGVERETTEETATGMRTVMTRRLFCRAADFASGHPRRRQPVTVKDAAGREYQYRVASITTWPDGLIVAMNLEVRD
jgi:hypothetical protein